MTLIDRIAFFEPLDLAAVALLLVIWIGLGWWVDNPSKRRPSTSFLMAQYRQLWMREMVTRHPRMFDAQLLASLRQGTTFFASTSMISIGGALALLGNAEQLAGIAQDITSASHPRVVWEMKLLVLLLLLTNAFLKFAWANRLFGYCSVVMAAVPNDIEHEQAYPRAEQAAQINITAARSFNSGLRSLYFSLATVAWAAGPEALITATIFTLFIIWRREFASTSRKILLND